MLVQFLNLKDFYLDTNKMLGTESSVLEKQVRKTSFQIKLQKFHPNHDFLVSRFLKNFQNVLETEFTFEHSEGGVSTSVFDNCCICLLHILLLCLIGAVESREPLALGEEQYCNFPLSILLLCAPFSSAHPW